MADVFSGVLRAEEGSVVMQVYVPPSVALIGSKYRVRFVIWPSVIGSLSTISLAELICWPLESIHTTLGIPSSPSVSVTVQMRV